MKNARNTPLLIAQSFQPRPQTSRLAAIALLLPKQPLLVKRCAAVENANQPKRQSKTENKTENRPLLSASSSKRRQHPLPPNKVSRKLAGKISVTVFPLIRLVSGGGECDKNTTAHWYATTATAPPCSSASPLSPQKPATILAKTIGLSGIESDTPAPRPTANATR